MGRGFCPGLMLGPGHNSGQKGRVRVIKLNFTLFVPKEDREKLIGEADIKESDYIGLTWFLIIAYGKEKQQELFNQAKISDLEKYCCVEYW